MTVAVELSPRVKSAVTAAVMIAAIMQMLDTTIANVALPHMQGSLSATQDQLAWILTSYIVAAAIMTLPVGWLSGRYGRKNVFVVSIAGFTLASLLCGVANSLNEMILFRILQGLFGASMVPLSQAILLDINPKESHSKAMSLWAVSVMIGPILGPTLGGFLTEYYSWRWVFYINLPLGIAASFILLTLMPDSDREERAFDKLGFVALAIFIASIQLILDRGHHLDWFDSLEIQLYCGLVAAAMWVYVTHTKTTKHPFLTPAIFQDHNFVTSLIFMFFIGLILLATMALLPPYMQNIMGYPVFDVGTILAPRGFGTMISMLVLGKFGNRLDPPWARVVWINYHSLFTWADVSIQQFCACTDDCYHRHYARLWTRLRVHASEYPRLLHAGGKVSRRGSRAIQPDTQPWQQHWRIDCLLSFCSQRSDPTRISERTYHTILDGHWNPAIAANS